MDFHFAVYFPDYTPHSLHAHPDTMFTFSATASGNFYSLCNANGTETTVTPPRHAIMPLTTPCNTSHCTSLHLRTTLKSNPQTGRYQHQHQHIHSPNRTFLRVQPCHDHSFINIVLSGVQFVALKAFLRWRGCIKYIRWNASTPWVADPRYALVISPCRPFPVLSNFHPVLIYQLDSSLLC